MKPVSTSNFELERNEGLQRSKKPARDAGSDGKAPEFSLSMLNLNAVSLDQHETQSSSSPKSESDSKVEIPTPNVEALAAAPVSDKNLIEGFQLFGSVFSLLQMTTPSFADHDRQQPSALDSNSKSRSVDLARADAIGEVSDKDGFDNVVIDFDKVRKSTPVLPTLNRKEGDRPFAVGKRAESGTTSELGLHHHVKLSDQNDTPNASVIQLRPKVDSPQFESDALTSEQPRNVGSQGATPMSDIQSSSSVSPRVDQIVRAVVEQRAELSGTHLVAAERQSHAGLTGQTLRLSLHPSELGSVQISVSKRGNRLQVTIVPDLESTGRLLLNDAEQLVKRLGLASAGADHVQIHIATCDGPVEVQTGDGQTQFSTRSEKGQDAHDGQHTSSHTSNPNQQERQNTDEKRNISRKRISDHKPGGEVYI